MNFYGSTLRQAHGFTLEDFLLVVRIAQRPRQSKYFFDEIDDRHDVLVACMTERTTSNSCDSMGCSGRSARLLTTT